MKVPTQCWPTSLENTLIGPADTGARYITTHTSTVRICLLMVLYILIWQAARGIQTQLFASGMMFEQHDAELDELHESTSTTLVHSKITQQKEFIQTGTRKPRETVLRAYQRRARQPFPGP